MKPNHNLEQHASEPKKVVGAVKRILVPLGLTNDSRRPLQYAAGLAKEHGASVCLLHVVDFGPLPSTMGESPVYHPVDHLVRRAERHLRMLAHRDLPPDVPVRILVRTGNTAGEIVKAANGICADLIVLDAPRRSWFTRVYTGDPTAWVESQAPCSVVVLRETDYGPCECPAEVAQPPGVKA